MRDVSLASVLLAACAAPPAATPWNDDGITLGAPVACEAPLPTVAYDEVGAARGLAGAIDPSVGHHHGGSAAVADLDADGDVDLVLGFPDAPPVLYRWEGDRYVAEALPEPAGTFLLNLADIDADGDLDLLAGGYRMAPVVLANDGAGAFAPLPLPALPAAAERVRELSPGDLDGDGHVDLYAMANSGGADVADRTDFVLHGDGAGGFVVAAGEVVSVGRGFDAVWADLDVDGDRDIYVVNDDGAEFGPNRLLRNDGGRLVSGGADCACEIVHLGMGGDAADPSGDGVPDLYLTAVGHNVLLESLGDGSFVDTALARGADPLASPTEMGWGAIWLDHDNDGVLDLLVAQGDRWALDGDEAFDIRYDAPVNLLRGDGAGYAEVGDTLGLDQAGSFRSVVAEDLNGDGVLDLLATHVVEAPRLYVSRGCTADGWLRVEAPPGTRVEVEAGGRRQVAWTTTESSYGAGHASFVHVGLGAAATVDHLVLTSPDGGVREAGGFAGRRVVRGE